MQVRKEPTLIRRSPVGGLQSRSGLVLDKTKPRFKKKHGDFLSGSRINENGEEGIT